MASSGFFSLAHGVVLRQQILRSLFGLANNRSRWPISEVDSWTSLILNEYVSHGRVETNENDRISASALYYIPRDCPLRLQLFHVPGYCSVCRTVQPMQWGVPTPHNGNWN